MKHATLLSLILVITNCGGYKAADSDELEAKTGQIVGVLVDSKGKAHPDATIQLIESDGTEALISNNMDSDGSFSLWPPGPGTYNIIGIFGETEKVIKQDVEMNDNLDGINVGTLEGDTVAILSVQVTPPEDVDPTDIKVEVLGTEWNATTVEEGIGIVAGLPAGTYSVKFTKDGLKELVVEDIELEPKDTIVRDDITMEAE
ncbi:MAG: carboxypeptidase-like regulatory domain-containing protein [Oligoflexales bacterium]